MKPEVNPNLTAFTALLRRHLAADEIDLALDRLLNFLGTTPAARLRNEAILLSSRLRYAERSHRLGVMAQSLFLETRNQVVLALADLLTQVERALPQAAAPVPQTIDEAPSVSPDALEAILGRKDSFKPVAWLERGVQAATSVCRIRTPSRLGTGFLLEGGWVLTCHHVLPDPADAGSAQADFNYQADLQGEVQSLSSYRLEPGTYRADQELDVCVARVSPRSDAPALEQWGTLTLSPRPPEIGSRVTIIQHPDGGPKSVALTANEVINVANGSAYYLTDTLPGSSGAPVFDDSWSVVAIHRGQGGRVANPRGSRVFTNQGVLIERVTLSLGLGRSA